MGRPGYAQGSTSVFPDARPLDVHGADISSAPSGQGAGCGVVPIRVPSRCWIERPGSRPSRNEANQSRHKRSGGLPEFVRRLSYVFLAAGLVDEDEKQR